MVGQHTMEIFQMRPELQNAPNKLEAELCYTSSTHTQPAQNSLAPKTALKSQAGQCLKLGSCYVIWAKSLLKLHEMTGDLCWSCAALSSD